MRNFSKRLGSLCAVALVVAACAPGPEADGGEAGAGSGCVVGRVETCPCPDGTGAQRCLEALKGLCHRSDLLIAETPKQRSLGRLCKLRSGRLKFADPFIDVTLTGPSGQFSDRAAQRAVELKRRLAPAPSLDVGAGTQSQFLAGENHIASA